MPELDPLVAGYTGPTRWLLPYADMLTLLVGFLVVSLAWWMGPVKREDAAMHPAAHNPAAIAEAAAHQKDEKANADGDSIGPSTDAIAKAEHKAEEINAQLESQFADTPGVTVQQNAKGWLVSFRDAVLFAPGEANLTTGANKTLDDLAAILMQTPYDIRVEGHTDDTPINTARYPSNWELSTARATTIVKHFVTRYKIAPERLSAMGYGEYRPVAQNSTLRGKQKNRRVDIVILRHPQDARQDEESTAQAEVVGVDDSVKQPIEDL